MNIKYLKSSLEMAIFFIFNNDQIPQYESVYFESIELFIGNS